MPTAALWTTKKIFSTSYTPNQAIPVELTKYLQSEFIGSLFVRLTGTATYTTAGTPEYTGRTNPEDLLINATLTTNPTVNSVIPFNQVSGRALRLDSDINLGCFRQAAPILSSVSTAQTLDVTYRLNFRRKGLRKGVEYGFDISRYTGALLTLTFGDISRLITTGTMSWTSTVVEVWAECAYNVNPQAIHAHELFEMNFPILATQSDFLINQLPSGFIYTDLWLIAEDTTTAGVSTQDVAPFNLSNGVLNNVDIEGGGRIWLPAGDLNADCLQRTKTVDSFDGSVTPTDDPAYTTEGSTNLFPNQVKGLYLASVMKYQSGMYTRQIDALTSQILMKLNVTFPAASGHTYNIRLVGRRMVPNAVYKAARSAPSKASA